MIACLTMLIDHIGAIFIPWDFLRIIGRVSFPIYCFLLAEGAHFTRDPKKYAIRLGIGALLAELPYDLLFFGEITLRHQSVMVTLLLGFISLQVMRRCTNYFTGILSVIPFALLAELVGTDYGGYGVLMINLFGITRGLPYERLLQTIGLFFFMDISSDAVFIGTIPVPMQTFAVLSMLPISLYSGQKGTASKLVQCIFYLFYPVHLTVLLIFQMMH